MNKDENRGSKNYIESHAIRVCSFYTRRRVYSSDTKSSTFVRWLYSYFWERICQLREWNKNFISYSAVMHWTDIVMHWNKFSPIFISPGMDVVLQHINNEFLKDRTQLLRQPSSSIGHGSCLIQSITHDLSSKIQIMTIARFQIISIDVQRCQ